MDETELPPPIPVDTEVDQEAFAGLLVKVERIANRDGWDQPFDLRVVYDTRAAGGDGLARGTDRIMRQVLRRFGPVITCDPYAAATFAPRRAFPDIAPWAQIRNVAMNLAYASEAAAPGYMLGFLRCPGVIGFAVTTESYLAVRDGAEGLAMFRGKTKIGPDTPDAVECRNVRGIDVTGWQYQVERRRGRGEPELTQRQDGYGDVTTSLRILRAALTGTVPPADRFDEVFPTLAQVADRIEAGQR